MRFTRTVLEALASGRAFAEMRAMTPHPIKSTRIKWRRPSTRPEEEVRQSDEARF